MKKEMDEAAQAGFAEGGPVFNSPFMLSSPLDMAWRAGGWCYHNHMGRPISASMSRGHKVRVITHRGEVILDFAKDSKSPSLVSNTKKNPLKPLSRYGTTLRLVGRGNVKMRARADHLVQVKSGAIWKTLAAFHAKLAAIDYGQLVAKRYPRRQVRYFGPGSEVKKNPLPKGGKGHGERQYKVWYLGVSGIFVPFRASPSQDVAYDLSNAKNLADSLVNEWTAKDAIVKQGKRTIYHARKMKKNPASRSRIAAAANRFARFTGHKADRSARIRLPQDSAGLAIGPVLAVAYETVRDGKREKYLHDFRSGSRPTLAASSDGKSLFLLGGAYRFTDRGIVDKGRR